MRNIVMRFTPLAAYFFMSSTLVITPTIAAAANLVSNGSFENPGFTHTGSTDNFRYLSDGGDTSITDWIITRLQTAGEKVYWFHSSRSPTFDGEYALALTDGGKASAFVTVQAGQSYELTFLSYRDLSPPVSNFALTVSVGTFSATLLPSDAIDTGISVGNQNWLRYQLVVNPSSSGTIPISILNIPDGITTFDGGVAIDAVSLSPVPEPATWLLLIAGIAAVRMVIRRGDA